MIRSIVKRIRAKALVTDKISMQIFYLLLKRIFYHSQKKSEKKCLFVYDLRVNDLTYNFAYALICAQSEMVDDGFLGCDVMFLIDPEHGFAEYGKEYESIYDVASKSDRLFSLVIPTARLSPFVDNVFVLRVDDFLVSGLADRFVCFPRSNGLFEYGLSCENTSIYRKSRSEVSSPWLRASANSYDKLKQLLECKGLAGKPLVTITIRASSFDVSRNSSIPDWVLFVEWLDANGYRPLVIPDSDNLSSGEAFNSRHLMTEVCFDVGLRMALYETAFVNFFVANGCAALGNLGDQVKYISMNQLPLGSVVTTVEAYESIGMEVGENYRFANSNQWMIYDADKFDLILENFKAFERVNDARN